MRILSILISSLTLLLIATSSVARNRPATGLQVRISLAKTTFEPDEAIPVTIILTNNSRTTQQFWFDKHRLSTGGPAQTSILLTAEKTGNSVLKYSNKAILSSQLYTEDQVKRFLSILRPGEHIRRTYLITDMAVLQKGFERLPAGYYRLRLFYKGHPSNTLRFRIR